MSRQLAMSDDAEDRRRPSKKHRPNNERIRVSRACDRCKSKKTRCTGQHPCPLCLKVGVSCEFTAAYTRGRVPSIPSGSGTSQTSQIMASTASPGVGQQGQAIDLVANVSHGSHEIQDDRPLPNVPTSTENSTGQHRVGESYTAHNGDSIRNLRGESFPAQSSRNSPEPSQTDLQGHYVGPSSGMSFLLRLQKKLRQNVAVSANSSIFTFGDAPLPEYDTSVFVLPPKEETRLLVARYFDFAVPTHRFLHRPTVENWLEEFYDSLGVMPQKDGARERTALLFMVLAQAKEYDPRMGKSAESDSSARYFVAAEHQLTAERGEIRLTSVQARLCQCFYLLSQSRINHCWSLFGTTAHLVLAIGIHRRIRPETSSRMDQIELECRKRVFWAAYSLDNYLSAALGRPRTFHDDDIDQDFPTVVNDTNLTSQGIIATFSKSQSIMVAPVAHAMLSRVISNILRDLYALRAPSLQRRIALAAKYSGDLRSWRENLPQFLNTESLDSSLLIPLFQRQRNVLNLSYYHALILVYRPFLLRSFSASTIQSSTRNAAGDNAVDDNVAECLKAAMSIVEIVDELVQGKQIYRAFWFTHYFAFCAVVILYVYIIQHRHSPAEKYADYFTAAAKCQAQISSTARNESLAQRYGLVLEELRREAVRETRKGQREPYVRTAPNYQLEPSVAVTWTQEQQIPTLDGQNGNMGMDFMFAPPLDTELSNTSPRSLMADLTGWGEFDHMVSTAGIGGLESFFMDDMEKTWEVDINLPGLLQ